MNLDEIQAELLALQRQKRDIDSAMGYLMQLVKTHPQPVVTDHAVLRYLERYGNVDVDAIRRNIVGDRLRLIATVGTGEIKTPCGMRLVIKEGRVVTIC